MMLLTLLILVVCRMHVIYELHNGPCSPCRFCGSVVEHCSTESEGLILMETQNVFFVQCSSSSVVAMLEPMEIIKCAEILIPYLIDAQ